MDYIEDLGPELRKFVVSKDDIVIHDKIGKGAYGEVFKGNYISTEVAIKIFAHKKFNSRINRKFIQEAEILCSLRSPFIVLFMGICLNF